MECDKTIFDDDDDDDKEEIDRFSVTSLDSPLSTDIDAIIRKQSMHGCVKELEEEVEIIGERSLLIRIFHDFNRINKVQVGSFLWIVDRE
jgi:hypothetical protein